MEVCVRARTAASSGLLAFSLSVLLAAPAAAQTEGRNELTVFGGASLADLRTDFPDGPGRLFADRPDLRSLLPTLERRSTLGGSVEFGVRYGRRYSDTLTVEADFSLAPAHGLEERIGFGCPPGLACIASPGVQVFAPDILRTDQVVAYHYGGGLRLDLTQSAVRPSVVVGLGGVTYDGSSVRQTNLAARIGAGLATDIGKMLARLEVVDVIVVDHFLTGRTEHDVHVRVGVGLRW